MVNATTAAARLRTARSDLAISQSKLARLSGVSRFKICCYELGDGSLTPEEQARLREALRAEADRIRNLSIEVDFHPLEPDPSQERSR